MKECFALVVLVTGNLFHVNGGISAANQVADQVCNQLCDLDSVMEFGI